MTSPLFRRAWQALNTASREETTIRELGRTVSSLRGNSTGIMRHARQVMRDTAGMPARERYGAVSDFVREHIIGEVLRQLGPIGSVVQALLRPTGRALTDRITEEMRAALSLLNWTQQQEQPPQLPHPGPVEPQTSGGQGGRGSTIPPRAPAAPSPPPPGRPATPPGMVTMEALGRRYTFRQDDPIVTGEMIPVISSNVHSIGYDWNFDNPTKGMLKVRFLERQGRKKGQRADGPLYDYFNVHPEVFMAFQNAVSKGRFVWDRLRIRGTVSGHRFQYQLDDLGSTNYVPRKATRLGPNEHYLRREFTDQRTGRTHTSELEDEFVQRIGLNRHGPQGFVPQRGRPNRGTPNRGRP